MSLWPTDSGASGARGQQGVSGGEALADLCGVAGIQESTSGRAAGGDFDQLGTGLVEALALVGYQPAMPLLLHGRPAGAVRGGEEHYDSKQDRHCPKSSIRGQAAPLIAHDSDKHRYEASKRAAAERAKKAERTSHSTRAASAVDWPETAQSGAGAS